MSSGHFMATDDASRRNFNDFTLGTNQVFLILTAVTGCEELNVRVVCMCKHNMSYQRVVCVCVLERAAAPHTSHSAVIYNHTVTALGCVHLS